MANVLLTAGTGYMGRALIPELVRRGHKVRALVRNGSEHTLAQGAIPVTGNARDVASVSAALGDADVVVHLVGVAPIPARRSRASFARSICASFKPLSPRARDTWSM